MQYLVSSDDSIMEAITVRRDQAEADSIPLARLHEDFSLL